MTEQQPATRPGDDTPGQHRAPDQGLLERLNLSEPVRLRVYPVAMAVAALLVIYGLVSTEQAAAWLALASAALFGGGALAESVRAAVPSPITARRVALDAVDMADANPTLPPLRAATLVLDWNGVRQPSADRTT